jgi:hypothetical protein
MQNNEVLAPNLSGYPTNQDLWPTTPFLARFRVADRTTVVSFFGFHDVAKVSRAFLRFGVPDRTIKRGVSLSQAQNVLTCGRLGLHVCLTIH